MISTRTSMILIAGLISMTTGCTAVKQPANLNYFFVDKHGDVVDPETDQPYRDEAASANALRQIIETDKSTIMIFIHGGLNTKKNAIERAVAMQRRLEQKEKDFDIHPIFINWRSGPFISYWDHLLFHRKGEHWKYAGPLTSPFVLLEDLGRAVIRSPRTLVNTINTYTKTYDFRDRFSGKNSYKLEESAHTSNYFGSLTPKHEQRKGPEITKDHLSSTAKHAIGLVGNLVLDVVGPGSWDVMKRRTELMFVKARPAGNDEYNTVPEYTQLRKGGINIFLKTLEEYLKTHSKTVILVGHSMGTIIANKMLTYKPEITYDRIIYMGAACSISDFQQAVLPYMANSKGTEFYNYMLDPKAENMEAPIWGLAGTGSLLVQIDDIYERPVAENQRTLGRWEFVLMGLNYFDVNNKGQNYEMLKRALKSEQKLTSSTLQEKSLRKRIHLRTIPFARSSPTRHGEFDDLDKVNDTNGYFWEEDYHAEK